MAAGELRAQALDDGFGLKSWLRRYRSILKENEIKAAERLIRLIERQH